MNRNTRVAMLKQRMDAVLVDTGFAGYVGAFVTYDKAKGMDVALAEHALPYPNKIEVKQHLHHMMRVLRGDLLVNTGREWGDNQEEEFLLDVFQLQNPVFEIAFRFTSAQMVALFEIAAALVYQPEGYGMKGDIMEGARELIRGLEFFIEPSAKDRILLNAELMRDTMNKGTFGTGIIGAGIEQLSEELRAEAKRISEEDK